MKQVFLFLILMAILFLVPAECIAQKKKKERKDASLEKIVPDIDLTLTHWEITGPGPSITNSNYSRFEPKEQMISGSNHTNWNIKQGGRIGGGVTTLDQEKKEDQTAFPFFI